MSSPLQVVSEQFPLLRDRVARLFEQDPLFRELCEDYETCAIALAGHKASEGLQREYSALRLRLETEMLRFLNEDAAKPGGRSKARGAADR
jgi:hypothetical protein